LGLVIKIDETSVAEKVLNVSHNVDEKWEGSD
jgi:hypothetical protein